MKPASRNMRINTEPDVARAVVAAHDLSAQIGFQQSQRFLVATAVSEIARNIVKYAPGAGRIVLRPVDKDGKPGIEVVAVDRGPGIEDLEEACREGFSTTKGSLGLGLPGARRLMDEFGIVSKPKLGTKVTMRKWL